MPRALNLSTSTLARKTPPTERVPHGERASFRVWAESRSYQEDDKPWKCIGQFCYLLDAIDYIAAHQDRGVDVVFQSPADVKLYRATDRRAVYRPSRDELCLNAARAIVELNGLDTVRESLKEARGGYDLEAFINELARVIRREIGDWQ